MRDLVGVGEKQRASARMARRQVSQSERSRAVELRPEDHVEVLLKGYKAGLISRRRIMSLAAKLPALAAALGVGAHLQSASAAGGGSARRMVTRTQEGSSVTMAYATTVGDTLNQHRSNFTVSRMIARHVLENLTWVNPADGSVNPWLAESWEISPDGLHLQAQRRGDVP
jgi:hypothetical protein